MQLLTRAKNNPIYPEPGYVKMVDGTVVVKLK